MDYSATFARHFARLVSLMLHDAGNIDEQKASLRALTESSRSGPVTFSVDDLTLFANDAEVPATLTGVHDVASQLSAHSIARVEIGSATGPADLLGMARIVAAKPSPGDGGAQALKKLAAMKARTISFAAREAPRSAAPTLASSASAAIIPLEPEEVLVALDSAETTEALTRVLDECVLLVEDCVRSGKPLTVCELLHGVVSRDAATPASDADRKRAYVLAIRRLAKPAILRAVASLIVKRPAGRQAYQDILERAGEEGADAVIEQINQAQSDAERRALVDLFRQLSDAVPALRRMLGDSRWFVVRNAADLLGELTATAAESDLVALQQHHDDRVRRAATNALARVVSAP